MIIACLTLSAFIIGTFPLYHEGSEGFPTMRYDEWLRLRAALYSCYQGPVQGKRTVSMNVPHHGAWLVLKGFAEVELPRIRVRAEPGQWLISSPGLRTQKFSDDVELLSVTFIANWPTGSTLYAAGLPVVLAEKKHPKLKRKALDILTCIDRFAPDHDYYFYAQDISANDYLTAYSKFTLFLSDLIKALDATGITPGGESELDPRIVKALDLLEMWPVNQKFSTSELASNLGLSIAHLERLFIEHLGRTPKQYFDQRRLTLAEGLLKNSDLQIKEAAYTLGFPSQGHFTRWFKRFHYHTPIQYHKTHAKQG